MRLPPILDVRDDLRRALAEASDDVDDEGDHEWTIAADNPGTELELADRDDEFGRYLDDDLREEYRDVVERLHEFEERDDADQQGLLDDVDNRLLRVEEKIEDDDASRRIQSIRERIHVYRDDLTDPGANLVVENAELLTPDGDPADVGDVRGRRGVVRASVLDNGAARGVSVTVVFLGEWGDVLAEVTGPTADVEPGETETFTFEVAVPDDAVDWAVVPAEVV